MRVVVINPEGPGETLFSGDEDDCRAFIADSRCAYDYHFGVAIADDETGLFDFGDADESFEPWPGDSSRTGRVT